MTQQSWTYVHEKSLLFWIASGKWFIWIPLLFNNLKLLVKVTGVTHFTFREVQNT